MGLLGYLGGGSGKRWVTATHGVIHRGARTRATVVKKQNESRVFKTFLNEPLNGVNFNSAAFSAFALRMAREVFGQLL